MNEEMIYASIRRKTDERKCNLYNAPVLFEREGEYIVERKIQESKAVSSF